MESLLPLSSQSKNVKFEGLLSFFRFERGYRVMRHKPVDEWNTWSTRHSSQKETTGRGSIPTTETWRVIRVFATENTIQSNIRTTKKVAKTFSDTFIVKEAAQQQPPQQY